MTMHSLREVELFQTWAKMKQIDDIIVMLKSEKKKLKDKAKTVQGLMEE